MPWSAECGNRVLDVSGCTRKTRVFTRADTGKRKGGEGISIMLNICSMSGRHSKKDEACCLWEAVMVLNSMRLSLQASMRVAGRDRVGASAISLA